MEKATIETIAAQFAEGNYDHYTADLSLRTAEQDGVGVAFSYGQTIATRDDEGTITVHTESERFGETTEAHVEALEGCFDGLDVEWVSA